MQDDLDADYPALDIQIIGINETGEESDNSVITAGRDLPWLQDVDDNGDGLSDVWQNSWQVTYRDVVILDANNVQVGTYNLTDHDLEVPDNYDTLRQMLVDAATAEQPPTGLDLLPDSDSGTQQDDDFTSFNNSSAELALRVHVSGLTDGALVRLFADGVQIGETIADGTEADITSDGVTGLADGLRTFAATQEINGLESDLSTSLAVTIDTTAPGPITPEAPAEAIVDVPYVYDAQNGEEGTSGFAYTLADGPNGMAIDSATGQLDWTPTDAQLGSHAFEIRATDRAGNVRALPVDVEVLGDIPAVADSTISGTVYSDSNNNRRPDPGEFGLPGTMITLQGVDDQGDTILQNALTAADGSYLFESLRPGTYELIENQPAAIVDGQDRIGTLGGIAGNDHFREIVLDGDSHSTENNFGEGRLRPEFVSLRLFLASTPSPEEYLPELMAEAEEAAGNTDLAAAIRQGATELPDASPVAMNDSFTAVEDGVLAVDAVDGVLSNDWGGDAAAESLIAVLVSGPSSGNLDLESDGSFNYTPQSDFFGTDSFTYRAATSTQESNEATVTIQVTAADAQVGFVQFNDVTLLAGSPLYVPLDGWSTDGQELSFTAESSDPSLVATEVPQGNRSMRISVAGFGDMVVELHEDLVPDVTGQIIDLADDGTYDGVIFHRVIDQFMIQGGDPSFTGGDTSGIVDFDDQFHVDLQHNRPGVLSMAKAGDDTNSSQFFITEVPTRHLDFNHSVFGLLVEGEDVREAISNVATGAGDRPLTDVVMESVEIFVDHQNAVLRLKAPQGASGEADVTVTVTDEDDQRYEQTFRVTVEPDDSNGGPLLEVIPDIQTTADTPATFQLTAIDVEGDPVVFSAVRKGDVDYSYDIDSQTGLITVTPPPGFVGEMEIEVRVGPATFSDTSDPYDSQLVKIQVA